MRSEVHLTPPDEEPKPLQLSEDLKQQLFQISSYSKSHFDQFDVFFQGLNENKVLLPTLYTETRRLDEMKNCDYHRAKL